MKLAGWLDADRPRPIKIEWAMDDAYEYRLILSRVTHHGVVSNSRSEREVRRVGGALKAARAMRREMADALLLARVFGG